MNTNLGDNEIDDICAGLTQNAARVRFLRAMGLFVRQKPNGRPLVSRAHYIEVTSNTKAAASNEPIWTVKT
jgi:hypothetical protein